LFEFSIMSASTIDCFGDVFEHEVEVDFVFLNKR
jgi:hypothetical protein